MSSHLNRGSFSGRLLRKQSVPGTLRCWVLSTPKSVSYQRWYRYLPYLYSLPEAFQGINIQPFFAGLQTRNHLLTFHFPRTDREAGEAAMEKLCKPWFGHFSSCESKKYCHLPKGQNQCVFVCALAEHLGSWGSTTMPMQGLKYSRCSFIRSHAHLPHCSLRQASFGVCL